MRRLIVLALALMLALAGAAGAENGGEAENRLLELWKGSGENRQRIGTVIPVTDGLAATALPPLTETAGDLFVSDGQFFRRVLAVVPDSAGLLTAILYESDQSGSGSGLWRLLPYGKSVPAASCTVLVPEGDGKVRAVPVLRADTLDWNGRRGMLLTLAEDAPAGSPVCTEDGFLAGIVAAEYAEGVSRVLALPTEEIVASLTEATALLGNLPGWGGSPEGFRISAEKNRLTMDWHEMLLPDLKEGEALYLVLMDTANTYLTYYQADPEAKSLALNLTPGRVYAAGLLAAAGMPNRMPEQFLIFALPPAEKLTAYGFRATHCCLALAPEEGLKEGETPAPVSEVTEEMLRGGRICFYAASAYQVTETIDHLPLLITLTDPDGVNYWYESGWMYAPEYMAEDVWFIPLSEMELTTSLNLKGYPAGIYRMAYYVDGDLADAFTFELK